MFPPPSTETKDALMYDDSSDAKNDATDAISLGCANLPNVAFSLNSSIMTGTENMPLVAFVSTSPGAIVLTRTPRDPSSIAAT